MSKRQKYGGRQKGTPNKVNAEIRALLTDLNTRSLRTLLDKEELTTEEALKVLQITTKHLLPTLQSIESSIDVVDTLKDQLADLSEAELYKVAELIHQRLN